MCSGNIRLNVSDENEMGVKWQRVYGDTEKNNESLCTPSDNNGPLTESLSL